MIKGNVYLLKIRGIDQILIGAIIGGERGLLSEGERGSY